jgi:drug/metabolite transporter (DMT)-like permease
MNHRPSVRSMLPAPAAGHFLLQESLTPAFAIAVAMVMSGLVLVNRPHKSTDMPSPQGRVARR